MEYYAAIKKKALVHDTTWIDLENIRLCKIRHNRTCIL